MPPINPQGSRASLVTAVVVFTILFVTSTIFAIYFNVQLRANEKDYSDYKKQYNGVVDPNALSTPELTALQSLRNDPNSGYTQSDTVMDIALRQRDALQQAIAGTTSDPTDSVAKAANDAIAAANTKLKTAAVVLPVKGLIAALNQLTDAVLTKQNQNKELAASVAQAQQQLADAKKSVADLSAARDKQVDDIQAKAAADLQTVNDQFNQKQAIINDLQKQAADAAQKAQAAAQAAQIQLADKDKQIADAGRNLRDAEDKLAGRRPDVANAAVRQADGRIVRLPGNNICYINLGDGDQVTPGLTFEVYDKTTGIPPIPPNATSDEDLPVGKASIEVTRVGATSSECRIVKTSPGAVLSEGDLIENLVYDPNTKYNFFVYGQFDLSNTGRTTSQIGASSPDTQVIKRLITQWGGQITDKVNVDTDFVVLGKEPELTAYSQEELSQPLIADKAAKEKAALDQYQEVRQTAIDLHIPILNQNRFLYYIGYYDLAKR